MASAKELQKGDFVRVKFGAFAGHMARVKKIDRHEMVHVDTDTLRFADGTLIPKKIPLIDVENLHQQRLVD